MSNNYAVIKAPMDYMDFMKYLHNYVSCILLSNTRMRNNECKYKDENTKMRRNEFHNPNPMRREAPITFYIRNSRSEIGNT